MGFGLPFAGAFLAANEAAKALAGSIAVGAKAVGQLPVIQAWKENTESSLLQSAYEAGAKTVMSVRKTVAVKATEWTGWMNVKAAEMVEGVGQMAGVQISSGPAKMQAALDNLATQKEWEEKQAASNAALGSMRDKVNQANAQRSAAAQQLKQKIVGAGKAAANAINNARKAVDALALKGIMRGGFATVEAVSGVYAAVKSKFSKAPIDSPKTSCPEVEPPAEKLRAKIESQEALLADAKQAAKGGPKASALNAAIPDLEKHVDVSKKALLAADVYNDNTDGAKNVAPGWDRLSDKEIEDLGLNPDDFHPGTSEFRAAIYKTGDKYTLVYKGTTATSEQDWENNALQGLGLKSDYYSRAEQLAQRVHAASDGKLDIVGHSLGGGLASAAVASLDDPNVGCTTYNSAGLNPDTVPDADLAEVAKQVDVYQVDGELLTTAQSVTSKVGLSPKAIGTTHTLPAQVGDSMVDKHLMTAVEQGLVKAGAGPEQKIQSLLGVEALTSP